MKNESKSQSFADALLLNLVLITTLLCLGSDTSWASESSQYHRSKYTTQQKVDSTAPSVASNAIDVFSDTTSCADTVSTATSTIDDDWNSLDETDAEGLSKIISALMAHGAFVGVILAIFGLLFALAVCALPFLAIILPIVYLIKRSNNKTRLREKMIEHGVAVPNEDSALSADNEALMQGGIQQTAIGVGLMILFAFMNIDFCIGIGGLVVAIGVGKIISAKVAKRKQSERGNGDSDAFDEHNNNVEL